MLLNIFFALFIAFGSYTIIFAPTFKSPSIIVIAGASRISSVLGLKAKPSIAIFFVWLIYDIVISIFYAKSMQSPGYKSQGIYLIDPITSKKVTFFRAFFRFFLFVIAGFSIVGLCICFFRKDKLNLHDLLSKTIPVIKK